MPKWRSMMMMMIVSPPSLMACPEEPSTSLGEYSTPQGAHAELALQRQTGCGVGKCTRVGVGVATYVG